MVKERIGRLAEDVLRDEMVAAAHADPRLPRVDRGIARDVASGVPTAHDEYALSRELGAGSVADRMVHLTVERSRILRNHRIPVVPHRGDHAVVAVRLSAGEMHAPSIAMSLDALDRRMEPDVLPQVEVVGERADVVEDLAPRRIVGIVGRHREAIERRLGAR